MSQPRGLPSNFDPSESYLAIVADPTFLDSRWDSPPSSASNSPPPSQSYINDRPTSSFSGHLANIPSLSSVGVLPNPGQRSPLRPIRNFLSGTSSVAVTPTNSSPSEDTVPATSLDLRSVTYKSTEQLAVKSSIGPITFYSDSSNTSTPEEEYPRFNFSRQPNDNRGASQAVGSKAVPGLSQVTRPTMAATMAPNMTEATVGLPRSSSADASISSVSVKSGRSRKADASFGSTIPDVATLISAAGSPEAVIQHLLKDKQSQSQQNSQLWRLVDKQRAMIMGLNKDLEAALKDKEKYRRKLKGIMSSITTIRNASGAQTESTKATRGTDSSSASTKVSQSPVEVASRRPDSPSLDSDSQRTSSVDHSIAPCPITPPADRPQPLTRVPSETTDARRGTSHEHTSDQYDDYRANEQPAAIAAKENNEPQQLRELSYNTSILPSRSLPSDPPKMPPPELPIAGQIMGAPASLPQPANGLHSFPSPPRKAPPAPLRLEQRIQQSMAVSADEDDSDTDYENILDMDETDYEDRGRRRTGANDTAGHDVNAAGATAHIGSAALSRDAELRQTAAPTLSTLQVTGQSDHSIALLSPGLPSSPRPQGNFQYSASASLSGRRGAIAPLSPRPPRQPIVLPSGALSASSPSVIGSPFTAPLNVVKRAADEGSASSPTERTLIYRGLMTDEYPELLLAPNALPSIEIKVASSRMKPSRASLLSLTQLDEDPVFTLAILSRADHSELWRVEKDIASLGKLDARLKQCAAVTARTPERSLFSGHAPAKLDARRAALEQYMEELLETPLDAATAVELCSYLSTHTLPPNADETGSSFRPTPENSGLKVGPGGRPLRSGYLTKKGKNFGGWKARFFVLDGPQLKYYETPGGAHLGTIKLRNAQIGKQSQSQAQTQSSDNASPTNSGTGEELDNQYRHAFLVLEPKKKDSNAHVKHVLCAESDRERDLWVDVLLQWIDYRDPEEVDPPSSAKESHGRHQAEPDDSGAGRPKKSSSSSNSNSGGSRSQHQHGDPNALIGVRYDSTHAGEAPQKGSAAPSSDLPSASSLVNETMHLQASKLISGPKDAHPISDSSSWGNKAGLGTPTQEEKKQRKRSFFGFGSSKTRSSSDGQDSVFGGSDAGSLNGPSQHHGHQGPVRQVFGAPLSEAVRFNPPVDVNVPLPSVVYRCIQYLDHQNAVVEEGIFRLSGSNVVIKQLRERFNNESDVNLVTDEQYYDIHAVASLLKLYLRELPTTILTRDLHLDFMKTTEMQDRTEKIAKLRELAGRLPRANVTLLKYLIAFLISIINNSDVNKMNVRNVGIVFSPTLNIPAQVFAMFLQNYEGVFGIAPEEYELPLPGREPRSRMAAVDASSQRPELARQLSTSSSNASPHRLPRKDAVRDQPRSTQTPPLMSTMQSGRSSRSSRSTPTPPLSSRSAYESGHGFPNSHEGHSNQSTLPSMPSASRSYDRSRHRPSSEERSSDAHSINARIKGHEGATLIGGFMSPQQQAEALKSRSRDAPF